ncbi:MAG: sugar ABC transporter substrate-binding protein [Chloroflexota bacterium]
MKVSKRYAAVAALGVAVVGMTVSPIARPAQAAHSGKGVTGKVAFLFSDFTTSPRWQFDKQYFKRDLKKIDPHVQLVVYDAKATQTVQQNQARAALTSGATLLIDVPVDSAQAAIIVRDAHANKPRVPVIAYDRLITGAREDAYASFNGFAVGVQQAKFLKSHVKKGSTLVSIAGSPTDNNAHLFYQGAMSVLRPLIKKGYYKLAYDKFTPNWDQATAQQEMSAALNQTGNKVQGVLVANDTMGLGVIQALRAQHLAGKVVVTGQDASVEGIQQICLGNQSMTVYKPIARLATAAAHIADRLLRHKGFKSSIKTPTGSGKTPTALESVETVTKANVKQTVIKDGYVKASQVPQCHL